MAKIILTGYMGSGKTTIARLLSEKLSMDCMDLDEVIEGKLDLSIPEIFNQKGELYFRKMESQLFRELIGSSASMVLSLGGGTPCYAGNHELLKAEGVVSVYLKASVNTLFKRLAPHENERPLLTLLEGEEQKEFIARHLFERSFYYNQAMHIVTVDEKSPDEITKEITTLLA